MEMHELIAFVVMELLMIAVGIVGNMILVANWDEPRYWVWGVLTTAAEVILATITITLVIHWDW